MAFEELGGLQIQLRETPRIGLLLFDENLCIFKGLRRIMFLQGRGSDFRSVLVVELGLEKLVFVLLMEVPEMRSVFVDWRHQGKQVVSLLARLFVRLYFLLQEGLGWRLGLELFLLFRLV